MMKYLLVFSLLILGGCKKTSDHEGNSPTNRAEVKRSYKECLTAIHKKQKQRKSNIFLNLSIMMFLNTGQKRHGHLQELPENQRREVLPADIL
jgi:hypothetical protein